MINSISVSELKRLGNINLIDIRNVEQYNNNHISNAVNINTNQLLINPDKYLSRGSRYYIYCQKGIQSRKLCQILANKGFNVVNIQGGYEAWILSE